MKLVLFFIAILLTNSGLAQSSSGWRGIIPLYSSRSEARLILGEPKEEGKYSDLFRLSDVKVDIIYAPGPCKGPIPGWNVKSGTVLTILVIPMRKTFFDESNLPVDFIKGPVNDDLSVEYTSIEKGIRYTVSEFGDLGTIYYMPSKRDSDLRCDNEEATPAKTMAGRR